MIFGKSDEQRLSAINRRKEEHLWFAWYPVSLDTGRMAWLESVQRKGTLHRGEWNYEYAENK